VLTDWREYEKKKKERTSNRERTGEGESERVSEREMN
jgi:hypothetical protein